MIDYTLYLVTDRSLSKGRSHAEVVESAIRGGVTCVQLRDKEIDSAELLKEAERLKTLLKPYDIPLIINDRVEVAKEAKAQGIHLGQEDMPLVEARKLVGDTMIIGITAQSLDEAIRAEEQGADYIGLSPVFATQTKQDAGSPLGLEAVTSIRRRIKIPLIGIGGIDRDNAEQVIQAGADGVAVVSAIVSADSPEKASRRLLEKLQTALMSR